jgi:hypothetical protein
LACGGNRCQQSGERFLSLATATLRVCDARGSFNWEWREEQGILGVGRARWGVGGALYPQSAIAGLNSLSRFGFSGLYRYGVLRFGARTAGNCEPGQGRKAAAISGTPRVMRGFLDGAHERFQAGRFESTEGARLLFCTRLHETGGRSSPACFCLCGSIVDPFLGRGHRGCGAPSNGDCQIR